MCACVCLRACLCVCVRKRRGSCVQWLKKKCFLYSVLEWCHHYGFESRKKIYIFFFSDVGHCLSFIIHSHLVLYFFILHKGMLFLSKWLVCVILLREVNSWMSGYMLLVYCGAAEFAVKASTVAIDRGSERSFAEWKFD